MTTNTRPVPNIQSAIAASPDGKVKVFLLNPWSQWFQQFTQKAPAAINVTGSAQPYQANQRGKLAIDWFRGTTVPPVPADSPPVVTFSRGDTSRNPFTIDMTGVHMIPIAIGDTVAWTVNPVLPNKFTVTFLGD